MFEDVHYPKHYLTEVIARIDFPSPISGIEKELPRKLTKAAMSRFPAAEPKDVVAQQFMASRDDFSTTRTRFKQWVFHGKDREKRLTVNPDSLFVVYNAYESYEALKKDFLGFASTFFEEYEEIQASRLGLRYVNNITMEDGNPLAWEDFIDKRMLCQFEFPPDPKLLARSFHNLELSYDDFNLRYQFGMPNPDYPAAIRRKLFVLDLDAYYQGPLDYGDVSSSLDAFHDCIQVLFERAITNKLKELMNA
ncbi:TIGR04255 family protein [Chloroflexota bacterium]